jgi:hypothetical protein
MYLIFKEAFFMPFAEIDLPTTDTVKIVPLRV